MKIENEISLDFDDVMIRPQRSTLVSRKDVDMEREFFFYHSPQVWKGLPIMCSNMRCVGTFTMAKKLAKHKIITALHKFYTTRELIEYFYDFDQDIGKYSWITIGESDADLEKIKTICAAFVKFTPNIVIDVANAHRDSFVSYCKKVREACPDSIIMAGNCSIPEMTQELIIHGGVDIVKIQTGPGKACRTRKVTGVGVGSLSCIDSCASVAHGLKSQERRLGLVCSDGGCKEYGDISKAFCAGADFVMIGSMFAGTDECDESEWKHIKNGSVNCGEHFKQIYDLSSYNMIFYGESSHKAQEVNGNEIKNYRASEGEVFEIPYKGKVSDIVQELEGGLRSCCTYIGATCIKDMNKCGRFLRVNRIHQNA